MATAGACGNSSYERREPDHAGDVGVRRLMQVAGSAMFVAGGGRALLVRASRRGNILKYIA
jgi:hypothetical protein